MIATTVATSAPSTNHAPVRPERVRARVVRGPVLLATDGRDSSDAAFRAARQLGAKLGVGIDVIAVYEPMQVYAPGADMPLLPPTIDADSREALETTVRRRSEAAFGRVPWQVELLTGERTRTIAEAARDRKAMVIVTGAGRHGVGARVLGGELALRTLRRADCPVLAVSPSFTGFLRNAVVAMDFSPASVRAAETALTMLDHDGTLVLLHVLPLFDTTNLVMQGWSRQLDETVATRFARLRDYLAKQAPPDVKIEMRSVRGRVVEEVLKCASGMRADLVAVGTHGPGFVERLFVGSVATDVLRQATCSVLAAPNPRSADAVHSQLRLLGEAELKTPSDWAQALDEFSRSNTGRRASLEVDDPAVGAQVEQSGYAFLGATYDHHDDRVEIMLGDRAEHTCHLTRAVPDVTSVGIAAGADGRDLVLCVTHGGGQTLLWLED